MPIGPRWATVVVLLALLTLAGTGAAVGGAAIAPGLAAAGSFGHAAPAEGAPSSMHPARDRATTPQPRTTSARPSGRGVDRPMIFPPNPDRLTAAPAASPSAIFPTAPAPMGISDFGVGTDGTYLYGTSSFEGSLTLNSFSAYTPTNVTNASYPSPDWTILQLDAVAVNVTLPPAASTVSNGTFWVQNGLHFNGTTAQLQDNVWNFSSASPALPSSTLYGKIGSILFGEVYSGVGPTFSVTLPVTIELFDNITTTGGHTVVSFGYSVGGHYGTYDSVTFNGSASASSPSQFLVNGAALNPAKLLYDAEFVLGGNGGGSNANIVALNGTANLYRFGATSYESVPSAFDYGIDTSETALGVAVAYTGTTAELTAGPSFLVGLWNANSTAASKFAPQAAPGWITVRIEVDPSFAFLFATNATRAAGPLALANYSYAPTSRTGNLTTDLPPPPVKEPYVFAAWADGVTTASLSITDNSTASNPAVLTLAASPTTLDAPVYLWGTAQAAAFGLAHIDGTGYATSPDRLWLNASRVVLAAPFLRVNEFDYPTFTLFSAVQVNDTGVEVNGFVQSPSTYNYTDEAGTVVELANWTQGYFFYYGDGTFSVQNTTIEGNTTLAYAVYPTYPASTVEFYYVAGASIANLTVVQDAIGVTITHSDTTRVTDLAVETGGLGVRATVANGLTLTSASASGEDRDYTASTLASLVSCSSVDLSLISVANLAYGIDANQVQGLTISGLTVTSDAWGLQTNDTSPGSVTGLTVGGGGLSAAGSWSNSTTLSFTSVDVNGSGLLLSSDSGVSLSGGAAVGYGSSVVAGFAHSSHGTFLDLTANENAEAVSLAFCSVVNVSSVRATNGSVGAFLANASSISGTGYTAENLSIGLILNNTTSGAFTSISASDLSTGVYVSNSSGDTFSTVTASNTTLGSEDYVVNTNGIQLLPIAAVGIDNDSSIVVAGVAATNYPFGVWSNNSTHLNISRIVAWYGLEAVALNFTNSSKVTEVFAFADALGISVQNCTGSTIATSTLEVSAGVGLTLVNGSRDTIEENNFIGNNGSSVTGTFSASHDQAYWNATSSPTFRANFWSDRSGSSYTIYNETGQAVRDQSPLTGFSSTYLEFYESGLPAHGAWTVDLPGINYTTNVSVLYVPGWELTGGPLPFSVAPIPGYPAHPSSGTLTWGTSSVTQAIVFGTPAPAGPGSILLWAAVAAAAAVVLVVVLLLRRRGRARRGPSSGASFPEADWASDDQR